MKNSIILVAVVFFCLVAFPTTTVGKYTKGWPNPSEISTNEMMFLNTAHSFSYRDSKVWKCTYSNGSAPAISISNPGLPTPSTPSPSTPSTPSPTPPTPKTSPPPPAPKKSQPSPTPTLPPPTPKKSPSTMPTPTLSPPTPKKYPYPPSTPSLPPPTPKKSPSPPPSDNQPSSPSNPPPEHHHQNPWEHIESCMRNMGPVGMCRWQMEVSFHTRLFRVSNYCCNLVANMKNECDDVAWGFFTDPFFVPLVRYTCHVNC